MDPFSTILDIFRCKKGFPTIKSVFFLDFRKSLFSIRAVLPYREHFGIFGVKFCPLYGRTTVFHLHVNNFVEICCKNPFLSIFSQPRRNDSERCLGLSMEFCWILTTMATSTQYRATRRNLSTTDKDIPMQNFKKLNWNIPLLKWFNRYRSREIVARNLRKSAAEK